MTSPAPFRTASALPRPLDPTYASNRAAVTGLGLSILGARLLGHSWAGSLRVGLGTFSGWAIARELDPDSPASAAAAMPLAFVGLLGRPATTKPGFPESAATLRHALPAFTALSSTRVLAATVGPRASEQDSAALSVQAALVALSSGNVASLMPGAALEWAHRMGDQFSPPPWAGGAALASGALPAAGHNAGSSVVGDLLSLAALGLGKHLVAPERITSACDSLPRPVSGARVQAARVLSLSTVALALLRRETRALAPLAAACLSVGARRWSGQSGK
ncbi:hypothetical protein [Deinococcus sp.]|uniref:hypothetical protein n=1 Tax=Deinococcus sp. TaxID=47478 RepID=UPI0025E95708|nr:hypothetical protein [Deinococcus sp.]